MAEEAMRLNEGKLEWSLMDDISFANMIKVLMFGAKKYAPNNWKKGFKKSKMIDSIQRHLVAMKDGQELDDESGLPHYAHLQCNLMFYAYHERRNSWLPED